MAESFDALLEFMWVMATTTQLVIGIICLNVALEKESRGEKWGFVLGFLIGFLNLALLIWAVIRHVEIRSF